jgi:acetylornithine deacetylase/succinyl-diaminopimelate desuccinylase-like protein
LFSRRRSSRRDHMLAPVGAATGTATKEEAALEWVRLLADEVGPRRPTGPAERRAAELVADRLSRRGLEVERRPFDAYSTFALPYGAALGVALLGMPAARRRPLVASALAAVGAALTSAEDGLINRPLTRAFAKSPSRNLVATIEPRERAERTACLVCHLDSSRSGLMFHPRFLPFLHAWIGVQAAAFGIAVAGPLLRRLSLGRRLIAGAYGVLLAGLSILVERELRGVDVPGASDNATGVAAVATLASELHAEPLTSTRVVCLFTGCEEAGVLGADAFVRELEAGREEGWRSWVFLNFDGVGAPATLRFLRQEGVLSKWPADAHLARIAGDVSVRRPELGLEGTTHNAGLAYDTTPVMARGGRAITFSTQDLTIPNYHSPTDTVENLDPSALERAIEVGREMLAAIDRGDAD